jgi:ribose transport system ATP-binding protein
VLRVRNLSWGSKVRDVSFDLHRGEILGIAGLVGAGRTELMHLIAGLRPPTSGTIELNGQSVTFASPRQAIRAGIGMLPEDRKKSGIIPLLPVLSNTSLPVIQKYAPFGWVANGRRRADVTRLAEQVNLRPRNIDRPIRYFSGGNQQKAILSRWLNANSEILIFDEPTRGIDVGAKQEIYHLMEALAQQGKAILMVSSELPEVLRLSDRVLVMSAGRAAAILERAQANEETIMRHAVSKQS